ncbi:fungal-specific transcription factor domain-containing protein [Daldinia decipiens]|uniref:fungal-specific transcription factor domain-containing protein n=1 Tax=Daldinia decipiens TaxID=326647 RepID=UPI0020C4E050|nr:fungal-specific transcription factor domain-containing protein [Daldinia decipiens]KAI1660990.1 fungal-specific transcription factor domain-containing protein [Daldinia decipiens]
MSTSTGEAPGAAVNDSGSQGGTDNSPTADTSPPAASQNQNNGNVPRPKRLACMICRKRKLRCDGVKPSCSTCTRLGHACAYDEVRRKSGPKRGYVKALEERLKQVETLLNKNQEPPFTVGVDTGKTPNTTFEQPNRNQRTVPTPNFNIPNPQLNIPRDRDMDQWNFNAESPQPAAGLDEFNFGGNLNMGGMDSSFTWEMIGLGLEEPLPPQEKIDELHQIYFDKIHPSLPMIHKFRYLAAMNLAPNQRPPVALRYAIWTQACAVADKFADLKDLFYQRARKYIEADYVKGYGEHMISVAHAQTHVLLASYEFKMMYFPRAWMSTGAAVRLCQMIGLHRLDGTGLDVKQCLPPPRDWTEREERRRTFWMAFSQDRYASIGTGWPMTVDERDIMTNLPSSEEAFEMSRPEQTQSLADSMCPAGAAKLSSFGGIVLMACLFGRNLVHLHRPDADDRDHDLNGEFWKRHRNMDNILLNTSLCLPTHLKLPTGLSNPNIVFTNMNIYTSTICLHQAAIFKADRNKLPPSVSSESKVRCITAANEIASIMRMVSHLDLCAMNPFISFCLYVAARVFVQYLKSRPDDSQTADSLRFLLAAMNALKRKNPLTESFLVQLDVDLEALGTRIPKLKSAFPRSADSPGSGVKLPKMPYRKNGAGDANCPTTDHESGGGGLLAYRHANVGNDNPLNASNNHQAENRHPINGRQLVDEFAGQNWLGSEQNSATRDQSASNNNCNHATIPPIMFPGFVEGVGSDSNDISASSNTDGPSNRPTPNSSTASDNRQSTTGPGQMANSSSRRSFDTNPIGSHQNLGSQAEMDATTAAFFQMGGGGTGMTPDQGFTLPDNWAGQNDMTPVTDGVLQHLLDVRMDLGWDSNT